MMMLAAALAAALAIPQSPAVPHLIAAHTDTAPRLDGRLDDAVWHQAQAQDSFTQKFPAEGQAPSERTTLRVLYDSEALYVGIECQQARSSVVRRLTRRGRLVESDWVEIDVGSRRDGKSAFQFIVNAAGVLVDGLRFNDTDYSGDWDENWDARAALTKSGWSAELKIPLRILRFDSQPLQSWDFQARRYLSTRQETDEWSFIPRSASGEVSRYGKLDGLSGLKGGAHFELRTSLTTRLRHRDAAPGQVASGFDAALSASLDLKWHPSQALTVDATITPDFAQVEPDQLVLNLTQFETYYPEKRPFFQEGIDTFATPLQLLYTRRIGRAPPPPTLRADRNEQLYDLPQPATIYGAAKLTGRIGERWTIAALQALTAEHDVQVQLASGARVQRLADPLTSFSVLRLRRDLGRNAEVAALFTATTRGEAMDRYAPLYTAPLLTSTPTAQLCPDGNARALGSRCFNNAYVSAMDWRWRSADGAYVTGGQAVLSVLDQGPPRQVRDGTLIQPGAPGFGVVAYANKEGGAHWIGDLNFEFNDRRLDLNDLGYGRRANNYRWSVDLAYRELRPWWIFNEARAKLEYFGRRNLDGLDLGSGYQVNVSGKFKNFWQFFAEAHYRSAYFDDREVGDGTALERAGLIGLELELTTNPTRRVSASLETQTQLLFSGFYFDGGAGVLVRALPQLDLELRPTVRVSLGEPRYIGADAQIGRSLFGQLNARSLGATLRATYTFMPRLTLQAYVQLFLASEHYGKLSFFQAASPRPVIHLADLQPQVGLLPFNPDVEQGVVNVNLFLRWEFRLGSTLYLVYARSQQPVVSLAPGEPAQFGLRAITRSPAADVLLLKLSYWIG